MAQILHYTIGPVQSFVGQARRTRDLWAGSFILSWLAGQAMAAIIQELNGSIAFPVVQHNAVINDELLKAIMGEQAHTSPRIGSLPNRFKAIFNDSVIGSDIHNNVSKRVLDKWQDLGEAVWREFIEPSADKGDGTQKIWEEQINNFWEINWVLAEDKGDDNDGDWLDIRKNMRSHWPVPQGGDHCTLMGEWQDISGYIQTPWQGKDKQRIFWQGIQAHNDLGPLELRDTERLCAISLIKRLFPRLSADALRDTIGWIPGARHRAIGNWPSTAYMAAIPWLDSIVNAKNQTASKGYAETVQSAVGDNFFKRLQSEQAAEIHGLASLGEAAKLDGNLFHPDALKNHRSTPLSFTVRENPCKEPWHEQEARKKIVKKLKELNQTQGNRNAQPFYALLVMDGDNMGQLLQNKKIDRDNTNISAALMDFTRSTAEIVHKHQGVLIYAGGDDVLAMLSMQTAIECAQELHRKYIAIFAENPVLKSYRELFTASASVIYAHFHTPLKTVLQLGHQTLDTIAKEANGRDSLVLTVLKPEGITSQWVGRFSMAVSMLKLIDAVRQGGFTTSFFYNLRVRYPFFHKKEYEPPAEQDKADLLLAEYCKGKNITTETQRNEAKDNVRIVLQACGYQTGKDRAVDLAGRLQLDGIYIARFLVDTCYNFGRERGKE